MDIKELLEKYPEEIKELKKVINKAFDDFAENFKKQLLSPEWEILEFKGIKPKLSHDEIFYINGDGLFNNYYKGGHNIDSMLNSSNYSVKTGHLAIHKVRRTKDNTVFCVGDKIVKNTGSKMTISKFSLLGKDNKMYALSADITIPYTLDQIEHVKTPILTTEDGVEIYDENTIIYELDAADSWYKSESYPNFVNNVTKKFSTKEARDKYILYNKPLLSLNEILESWGNTEGNIKESLKTSPLFRRFAEKAKSKL